MKARAKPAAGLPSAVTRGIAISILRDMESRAGGAIINPERTVPYPPSSARPKEAVTQISEQGPLATTLGPPGAEGIRDSLRSKYVCPFCGSVNDSEQGMCPRCTMENSSATRKATKTRIGPWYVLQTRNPAAPGMTWETLLSFVRKGRVKPRSIVRGPTTHQLWRFAAHVKGLSREFSICYSCGTGIEASASLCPTCNRLQDAPPNPDALLEASREGQQVYTTPPATLDGTLITLPANPPAAPVVAVPEAPVPSDVEFVMPALGGQPPAREPVAVSPTPTVSKSPSTPAAPAFSGVTGDTAWMKIAPAKEKERLPSTPTQNSPATNGAPTATPAGGRNAPRQSQANLGGNGSAPAGQKFNPYADDDAPPQPGRRNDSEGFLSAKDLAAAFNLGFVGEEDDTPVQQTVRSGQGSPTGQRGGAARNANMGMPAFNPARAPSRWRKLKLLATLLVIGGGLFGVALAVSEDLRQSTRIWLKKFTASLSTQTESDQLGTPGSDRKKLDKQPAPKRTIPESGDAEPTPGVPGAKKVTPGSAPDNGVPGGAVPAAYSPTTAPTTRASDPVPATSPAVPPVPPLVTQTPPVTRPAPQLSWRDTEAYRLYSEAGNLESTNPKLALEKYKLIKTLPKETWPVDLDVCIRRAESKLKRTGG